MPVEGEVVKNKKEGDEGEVEESDWGEEAEGEKSGQGFDASPPRGKCNG